MENSQSFRRSLGVIAFCRLGGGDMLSRARRRELMVGRNFSLPLTWRGLNLRRFRSDAARELAAVRTDDATIGFLRRPRIRPDGSHSDARQHSRKPRRTISRSSSDRSWRLSSTSKRLQKQCHRRHVRSRLSWVSSWTESRTIRRFASPVKRRRKSRWEAERSRSFRESAEEEKCGNGG